MGAWPGDSDRCVHAPAGVHCSAIVAQCVAIGSCALSAWIRLEFLLCRRLNPVSGSALSIGAFTDTRRKRSAGWTGLGNRQSGKRTCVCCLKFYHDRGGSWPPGLDSAFVGIDLDQKETSPWWRNETSRRLS